MRPQKSVNAFKLVKPYFTANAHRIMAGIACLLGVDILQLLIPRIVKRAVDGLTELHVSIGDLSTYALYIVAAAIGIGILRYFWRHFLIGNARYIEEGLRNQLFSHIQLLSASFFDRNKTGDLMAHATNDIMHIRMAAGMGMVALTDAVFLGTAAIGFMVYINLQLTLLALIPMPLIVFCARFFSRKMHRQYQNVQSTFADMTEMVRERFAGIRVVKAYNRERAALAAVSGISRKYIQANLSLVRITGLFFPLMIFFTNLSLATVIFLGGRQTITNTITTGDFVAFISYLNLLTWPMMALGWMTSLMQRGAASLDRIHRILSTKPEIVSVGEAHRTGPVQGKIQFQDIRFRYKKRSQPALSEITFSIASGHSMGIVGPPGSGKTTLLNLIPRLYDSEHGCIALDGLDIRKMRLENLRSCCSCAPQEPFLFSGTIVENITFARKTFDAQRLEKALQNAALDRWLKQQPQGIETTVGEKGIILSGGQKQRVGLARAFYHDAPILLLDDPVSQVDTQTGTHIIRSIQKTAGAKTVIIVSHRLSAVKHADAILVMDQGRIAAQGSHMDLLESNAYYASTFQLQQIEEEVHEY